MERIENVDRPARQLAQQIDRVFAMVADSVVVVDSHAVCLYANEPATRLLGRPADELVGADLLALHPEVVGSPFHEAFQRALVEQVPLKVEALLGPWARWFEARIYPAPEGLTVFIAEVTERRRIEIELAESESRLVRAQAVAHVGSWELDLGSGAMWGSEEAFRIYGLERTTPSLPLALVQQIPTEEDRPRLDAALRGLVRDGAVYDLTFRIRRANDAALRVIHSYAEAVRDATGTPTRVLGTIQDITSWVAAEEERARLAAAIDQTSDAVAVEELDGTITYANRAFRELYGRSAGEVLGVDASLVHGGDDETGTWEAIRETVRRGETWSGAIVHRGHDGTRIDAEATISPVRDERGEVTGCISVERDVSRERRLEARLQEVVRLEAIGQLAGGIAHDFNNLITAIRGYAELLLDHPLASDEAGRDDLGEIIAAAGRASALTGQLLAFSRRQVLEPRVLDPAEVVGALVPMLSRLLGEHIEVQVGSAHGVGRVRADRSQLDQVIVNLAVNARDAMPGGGTLAIETADVEFDEEHARAHPDLAPGPYVMLAVSDTGTGMDEDTRARIFEPFFTTKEPGAGTGMGLAMVYGVVRQSGGSIEVYSEPGHGSCFRLYLPRVDDEPVTPLPATPPEASAGRETILVVEDDRAIRELAGRALSSRGYAVLLAEDGAAALAILMGGRAAVDLLITDVVMPGMNGHDLAARVRAVRPGIRVLFTSGFTHGHRIMAGGTGDREAFLPKPFTAEGLAVAARRALDADG